MLSLPVPARKYAASVRARLPDPEPLDVDAVTIVYVGTVGWGVALAVSLAYLSPLRADGHVWWVATCVTGLLLGLLGIAYCRRRRTALRHPEAPAPPAHG